MPQRYYFRPVQGGRGQLGAGIAEGIRGGLAAYRGATEDRRRRAREDEDMEWERGEREYTRRRRAALDQRADHDYFTERGGGIGTAPTQRRLTGNRSSMQLQVPRMTAMDLEGNEVGFDGTPYFEEFINPNYTQMQGGYVESPQGRDQRMGRVAMALLAGAEDTETDPGSVRALLEAGIDPERATPASQRPGARQARAELNARRAEGVRDRQNARRIAGMREKGATERAAAGETATSDRLERQHEMRMEELDFLYPGGVDEAELFKPDELSGWREVLESRRHGLGKSLEDMTLEEVRTVLQQDSELSEAEIGQLLIQLFGLNQG